MEYTWLYIAFILFLAYMLGSIPFSLWIGIIFFKKDIRTEGSGNAGTTNTFRVLGWKAGLPVFLMDASKGWLAINLIHLLPDSYVKQEYFYYLASAQAVAVVLGHVYPLFAGFKGGKGVATLLGVGVALYPLSGPAAFGVFIIVFLLSGYVSLASVTACIAFPLLSYYLFGNTEMPLVMLSAGVAVFVPITHLKNIRRLIAGTESRFLYKRRT
ncbi:MAG: acyl-phosphate glycerol 3-phosphate acyltransferase [Bacteroidetes bacterium]|nr:MAG: acyl-phosphate glycerol 3-phosphate acyltransferase [Bacteroidota bacterium]RLD81080.1 MAG: acyl-phosphate glycerol 3-phosphate acyltransferase [Bacteroidota bacterium]